MFATLFRYDQHGQSVDLRDTACYALPDSDINIWNLNPRARADFQYHMMPDDAWYTMPGIYHVYLDLNDIHGIYMVYPWIYHHDVYPSDWIYIIRPGYYIHKVNYTCQWSRYIHTGMDIHGISFDVYTLYIRGISWYIHGNS